MSLNRTLDRLFAEIRREARRNPEFADRLDAALRMHDSRRDVSEAAMQDAAQPAGEAGASGAERQSAPEAKSSHGEAEEAPVRPAPSLNPAGLYKREGEAALAAALAAQELDAMRALVAEHNLDPGGVTAALTRDALAAHILAQAKRRAERDEKMFDY